MKDYERPTDGNLSGGVAECSSARGATHKRTDSAGASVSSPVAGWALDRGADKTTYGYSLPLLVMETQPPLLSSLWANGQHVKPLVDGAVPGGRHILDYVIRPLPARAFKHPLCITLLQIARNPFFFFRLVFLVTRRDAARLARRVGFWARRAGD